MYLTLTVHELSAENVNNIFGTLGVPTLEESTLAGCIIEQNTQELNKIQKLGFITENKGKIDFSCNDLVFRLTQGYKIEFIPNSNVTLESLMQIVKEEEFRASIEVTKD